jgi:lipoprotein-releasing system permease protein
LYYLAVKQLLAKKKQTFLILFGISLGTMLFVTISGVQLGFRSYIMDALLNNTAHIRISGRDQMIEEEAIEESLFESASLMKWITPPAGKRDQSKLENYQGWVEKLSQTPEVFDFTPRLNINALIKKGSLSTSVGLIGTLPLKQVRVGNVQDYVEEGRFEDLANGGNKMIIGRGVARDLGVRVGQNVDIVTASNEIIPFKIVGITKFGDERIDKSIAFAHLTDVQKVNRTPGRVTEIAVALYDIDLASEIAAQWAAYSHDKVEDWKVANKMFMEMIKMQDLVRYFITFSILTVAAFGIYNVLTIMINQKQKEIAILRSVGYAPNRILQLVLIQGLILGISGGLLGIVLGVSVNLLVGSIDLGFELGKSNNLLMSYEPSIFVTAFIAALIASIIASYIPARAASKLTPIDIIRGHQ